MGDCALCTFQQRLLLISVSSIFTSVGILPSTTPITPWMAYIVWLISSHWSSFWNLCDRYYYVTTTTFLRFLFWSVLGNNLSAHELSFGNTINKLYFSEYLTVPVMKLICDFSVCTILLFERAVKRLAIRKIYSLMFVTKMYKKQEHIVDRAKVS